MESRNLGRCGLRVSPLALGTMNFGPETDEPTAHRILDRAVDAGVNLIDLADVYGADANKTVNGHDSDKGRTEEIVGRWLAGRRREDVVLVTKAYGRMGPGRNDLYLSAVHLRDACEQSLRRLGVDHVDVFMLHHVDRNTSWDELWEVLGDLRREGKIRYAGTSNFAAWQLVQGQEAALRRNLLGLVAEQSIYNLMERTVELELLPACREYGIGLMPYSPLNSGLLAGAVTKRTHGARTNSSRATTQLARRRESLAAYEKLCADLGEPPAVVGQAWLLSRPGVVAPIVGARTEEHLAMGLRAVEAHLPEEVLNRLDELFPGPGEAPEAYAW